MNRSILPCRGAGVGPHLCLDRGKRSERSVRFLFLFPYCPVAHRDSSQVRSAESPRGAAYWPAGRLSGAISPCSSATCGWGSVRLPRLGLGRSRTAAASRRLFLLQNWYMVPREFYECETRRSPANRWGSAAELRVIQAHPRASMIDQCHVPAEAGCTRICRSLPSGIRHTDQDRSRVPRQASSFAWSARTGGPLVADFGICSSYPSS